MKTLSDILTDVNSYIDLTAALPTGTDLSVRTNYAKQAVEEWGSSYRWRQLKNSTDHFATGATISLSTNFRSLIYVPHAGTTEYKEIQPEERHAYSSGDKYCYVLGGVGNYNLIINGLSTSGATLSFDWQRYPSNFATLSSVCEVPDPSFVRLKVISYVLQSRLDPRFQGVEAEAQKTLLNMIGREMNLRPGGISTISRFGSANWRIGKRNGS